MEAKLKHFKDLFEFISSLKKLSEKEIQQLSLAISVDQFKSVKEVFSPLKEIEKSQKSNQNGVSAKEIAFERWYGRIRNSANDAVLSVTEKNLSEGNVVCVSPKEEFFSDPIKISSNLARNYEITQTNNFLLGYNNFVIGDTFNKLFLYYEKNRKDKPLTQEEKDIILKFKPEYPKEKLNHWTWELNCFAFLSPEIIKEFNARTIRTYRLFAKLCGQFPRLLFVDSSIREFRTFSGAFINRIKSMEQETIFWQNVEGLSELEFVGKDIILPTPNPASERDLEEIHRYISKPTKEEESMERSEIHLKEKEEEAKRLKIANAVRSLNSFVIPQTFLPPESP